jgi:plasmid maintenance system antidote protein VapI
MASIMAEKKPETFGFRLRKLMRDRDLTIETTAWRAGLHPNSINKYINGEREPTFAIACKLSDALGCGLEDLRVLPRRTDSPHPPKPKKRPKPG